MLGPITLTAQEHPICQTTDGRLFATPEQVRKCLKDEAKAVRFEAAQAAANEATARANTEAGKVSELRARLSAERSLSDERLTKITVLKRRPKTWHVIAAAVAGAAAGLVVGFVAR